jgi:hypothetical protein
MSVLPRSIAGEAVALVGLDDAAGVGEGDNAKLEYTKSVEKLPQTKTQTKRDF